MQSDISSLELFFKRGGDVESKNHNGLTLLNLALNKKSDFTVERVLSAGADPNQVRVVINLFKNLIKEAKISFVKAYFLYHL